ncbi:MAG: membrane dipeptidase [Candidatus Solibacter usitatus]|nr:membrane dipeptidase [Candidatus Solibacter usitatus]
MDALSHGLLIAASLYGQSLSDQAKRLHRDALVLDAHVHMINRQFYLGGDIGRRVENGQVDLIRAREGGLKAMFFTLFVQEQYYPGRHETRHALRLMDLALRQIENNKDKIGVCRGARNDPPLRRQGRAEHCGGRQIPHFGADGRGRACCACCTAWDFAQCNCRLTIGPTALPNPVARHRLSMALRVTAAKWFAK